MENKEAPMPDQTAVQTVPAKEVAAPADLETFIMRACQDQTFDVAKLERLIALQERTTAAPIYAPLGFSVSWNSFPAFEGKMLRVVGTFSCHGHSETLEMTGPLDNSGGKNGIQGVASSVSYLKRQISKMFWNLVERGQDKDGANAKDLLPITQDQGDDITTRLKDCNADVAKFKKLFGVESIADLRAGQLKEVWRQLAIKEKAVKDSAQ